MKIVLIGAGSDLGVHIDGASLGPKELLNNLKEYNQIDKILLEQPSNIKKSKDKDDKRKNEKELNIFNKKLYNIELKYLMKNYFPITIGGDHSVAIASALAAVKKHDNIGIIWFDAHPDYNTFKTTISGNLHGLPLAAINGYNCKELSNYHTGNNILSKNTVVVGARSIDELEQVNLKAQGVTVFTTKDILTLGTEKVVEKAFEIAGHKTSGIHISYDLDLLSPCDAPGVSIPVEEGINKNQGLMLLNNILKHKNQITSFDLVEFNPLQDKDQQTKEIALNILKETIKQISKK